MNFVFTILIILCLNGCASNTKQTDQLFREIPQGLSRKSQIPAVPFFNQSVGHCGPATLAMVLNHHGVKVSVQELAAQVYTPKMQGSFQTDMISASRRQSMMAVRISGLESLLQEIQAGNPVIIFENLGIRWWPQYHYALVHGFDLNEQILIMHSGPNAHQRVDFKEFERSWKLGNYWGLVVLPAGKLTATASELSHLQAASSLEQNSKWDSAYLSYQAILKKWPESLQALIGMGNVTFTQREFRISVSHLKQAVKQHPDSVVAWHNLAWAQHAAGQIKQAGLSAKTALKLSPVRDKSNYQIKLAPLTD